MQNGHLVPHAINSDCSLLFRLELSPNHLVKLRVQKDPVCVQMHTPLTASVDPMSPYLQRREFINGKDRWKRMHAWVCSQIRAT